MKKTTKKLVTLGATISLGAVLIFMNIAKLPNKATPGLYQPGECFWHITDNPKLHFVSKIIRQEEVNNKIYYITHSLFFKFRYNVDIYQLSSASYIDDTHYKRSHKDKCMSTNETYRAKCLKNPDYKFTTEGLKTCPKTKKEFEAIQLRLAPKESE